MGAGDPDDGRPDEGGQTQERLRLLESVVASVHDAVVITEAEPLDMPGPRIVYANRAFAEMTGYALEELLGREPRFMQGPDTDRAELARIRAALERREAVRAELLNYRKDGTPFWVDLHIVPVRDPEGRVRHFASIQRDTTARRESDATARRLAQEKSAHAEAAAARRHIEAILESISDAFVAIDRTGTFTYVNRRAADIVQSEPDQILGRRLLEVFPALDGTEVERALQVAMDGHEPVALETYSPRLNRWLEVHAYPSAEGVSVYFRDVTSRRGAEDTLRISEARFSGILSIAADAIVWIDEDQRITVFNRGAERIFGYAAGEVLGKPLDLLLPEPVRDIHRQHVRDFARSGVPARRMGDRGRVSGRRKNGELFPADASISQIEVAGRRVFAALLRDITATVHAEQALAQANEQLRAVLRAAPIAIVALDLEGRVEIWNPAAERMFGWTEQEVIGGPPPIMPEDRLYELDRGRQLAARGETWTGVATERVRKDGSRVAVSVSTGPLNDPSGQLRGMIVLLEDITKRTAAEEGQRRLAAIMEATTDVVSTADPQGRVLYLNRAGRELAGRADLRGMMLTDLGPEWAATRLLRDAIPSAMRDGSWSGESAVLDRSGREVPVSEVIIAHKDARGQVEYLSAVVRDISERRAAEEQQRYLAQASSALTGSLEYGDVLARVLELIVPRLADYCVIDVRGEEDGLRSTRAGLLHRDRTKQALLDRLRAFTPRDARGLGPARVLRTGEPELLTQVTDAWLRAISVDDEHLGILQALGPQSEIIVPLRARGRVVGALTCAFAESRRRYTPEDVSLAQDLAGRAALALDNAKLYEQVQDALRMRDQVLGIVAHDLRNPLNTIALAGQLLLGAFDSKRTARAAERKQAEIIRRSVERANALIDDLLDVARMKAGMLTVRPRPEPAGAIAIEAVELNRPLAEQKELRIEPELPAGLPEIAADRDRILQVLGNLIGNAIKFTPRGGRVVMSACRADGAVRFRVSDSGPGISREQLGHAFDPFWQAHAGRAGAGLGLAIAKGIVEAHGGEIAARSERGEGTTIEFTVPLASRRD